jgi:membrane associated rhomboid family serine protease
MGLQLLGGFTQHGEGGVAFFAHVGGFLAGVVFIKLFERKEHVALRMASPWRPARVGFSGQ